MKLKLRRFNKLDFLSCYAEFPNGSLPIIGNLIVDGCKGEIIIGEQLEIFVEDFCYYFAKKNSSLAAGALAQMILSNKDKFSEQELFGFGFRKVMA